MAVCWPRVPFGRVGAGQVLHAAHAATYQVGPARPHATLNALCAAVDLGPGDVVEVTGALRRRFFRGGGGVQSRYDVEVSALRRMTDLAG